jgi:hypothetical protein
VDTSKVGTHNYTLTVADGTGEPVTASTTVVVREPVKEVQQMATKTPPPPPPPPPPTRQRWPDGRSREIKMALLCTMGAEKLNQFMVFNSKSKQNEYYKVGDDFDGGKLEFVHQYGGVVSWKDEFFVYPLGFTADQGMEWKAAGEYPELQLAADAIKKHRADTAAAKPKPVEPVPGSVEAGKPLGDAQTPSLAGTDLGETGSQTKRADGAPNAIPAANQPAEPATGQPTAPTGAGVQMIPLVLDPETAPTEARMGPPNPEPVAPRAPVRPRPKAPARPPQKPRP